MSCRQIRLLLFVRLFVYHTPEEITTHHMPDCAVAIDVLRATTTMAAAFNAGAEAVQVFSDIDQLMQVSEQWPADKRIRAGERGGAQVEGCDLGNSPLDHSAERTQGRRLFMSTTNGTRCLQRIQNAPMVITAALLNRQAVVKFLLAQKPETIWMVGSGWEGTYSLEDTVCAGAIAYSLSREMDLPLKDIAGNDALIAAVTLYLHWQDKLLELMRYASHGQRLLGLNKDEDLSYCAQLDQLDIVPIQKEPGVLAPF